MSESATIQTTPVFEWNYNSSMRFLINQGGTWSSKTYSILQVLLIKLIEGKGGEVATVTAETFPTLRLGSIRDFENIIAGSKIGSYVTSQANFRYTLFNKSVIEFRAFQDPESAKHGKRDYLFINEANNIGKEIVQQLIMRTRKQIFIDFNPSAEFWAHQDYTNHEKAQWFFSTYRNNPFCDTSIIEEIESYKHSAPELYRVFGLGRRGNFSGQVFSQVNWVPDSEMPNYVDVYGLDVGFSNSYTALSALTKMNRAIYAKEMLYARGLTDNDIVKELKGLGISTRTPIVVDNANQATITEINRAGFNAIPCKKRDVAREVQQMLTFKWSIAESSQNWKREARNYLYEKDKKSGDLLNTPVKAFDHLWDSARYAFLELVPVDDMPKFL
jgi:phage terminase large subunit